jgi:ubiquinone/menaquinone biosynthesis C-methylase UbiE
VPDTPVVDLDHRDESGEYLRYHAARDEQRPEYDRHRADVRDLTGAVAGSSLLEVGCGTGAHLPHFWNSVGPHGRVVAADSSEKMLDLARARLQTAQVPLFDDEPGVELVHGRLESLGIEGVFDVVLADRLIGHLEDPVAGLQHLAALARAGGRVVVINMLNAATTVSLGSEVSDRALAARVLAWRVERGTTSSWASSVVPSLAKRAGLEAVGAKCWTFTCRTLAETFPHTPLLSYGDHAFADGALSASEAAQWRERLEALDAAGEFAVTVTVRGDVLQRPTAG